MNGGILPLLLLGLTLGIALTSVPTRLALRAWIAAFAVALAVSFVPVPKHMLVAAEIGLSVSAILTALIVYLPASWTPRLVFPAGFNAGLWLGTTASAADNRLGLLPALALALIFLPISMVGLQKSRVATKVVASWMIAIGSLSVFVSMVPTPGYKQDHMQ